MERRREPRFVSQQAASVTVLGDREISVPATAVDVSGRGVKLVCASALPESSLVKIEMNDSLILGEVCYCAPEGAEFTIGIAVEQVLKGLKDLANLRARLIEDVSPGGLSPPGLPEPERRSRRQPA